MKKNFVLYSFLSLLLLSCTDRDDVREESLTTLQDVVRDISFQTGSVIACASGKRVLNDVEVYYYPRPGVSNIRYFETTATQIDPSNFANYVEVSITPNNLFNGYLQSFTTTAITERWAIVSFVEEDVMHLSNPIRLKHLTTNTNFENTVEIDLSTPQHPLFSWESISTDDDAIYFQVVSNQDQDLLSGTYTVETQFQYYELDNVVLNITREPPPALISGNTYGITLMGVSEDNWVNFLVLQQEFTIQ